MEKGRNSLKKLYVKSKEHLEIFALLGCYAAFITRNSPEERSYHLHSSRSLKSRKKQLKNLLLK